MKNIEIICIGNNERSPIAEAVFKDEARNIGVEDRVQITSSGLYVSRKHPIGMIISTMDKAIDNPCLNLYGAEEESVRGLLKDKEIQKRYEKDPEFRKQIDYYFSQAYNFFVASGSAFRDNVLARHGLEYTSERHQFPSQEGLDYVLTVTKSLVEPAKELIHNSKTKVTSLPEIAGTEDIPGGFGRFDINDYERTYDYMRKVAPIALEKILK